MDESNTVDITDVILDLQKDVGQDRESIVEFLRSFICGNENLLIDLKMPKQTRDLIETLGLHIT